MGREELVEYVRCVCVWLGAALMERIGFRVYQSCENRRSFGCVSLFLVAVVWVV